ncbi:hypothetical protein, partial [Mycoplasmoides pneumoniae]
IGSEETNMAMDTLLVVSVVGLVFSSFALVLALADHSTTRWQRLEKDEDRSSIRASFPGKHIAWSVPTSAPQDWRRAARGILLASNGQALRTNT